MHPPVPRRRGAATRSARRHRLVRFAFGMLAGIAVVATPMTASAHAELDTITPADKATVTGSPTEIVATFTEALDAGASSLKIVDAKNTVIVEGSTVGSDGTTMTLPIATPLAPGAYSVRWTSKSAADGDLDHGVTAFTVVAATPEPSVASSASPSTAASAAPSVAPSVAPTPAPSATPAPASSTSDAVIPIIAALVVLAAIGLWLLRGRSRTAR